MQLKSIYVLIITFFVVSCSSPTTQNENTNTEEHTEHAVNEHENHDNHDEHQHQTTELSIELNEGEKWEVNQEMKTPIETMKTDLQTYVDSKSTDYQKLATDLDSNTNLLIKTCTMKGKSHDELHKWLEPHMALVKDLKAVKDENEANEKVQHIQHSFELFNQYFK